jgi:hypothetical protein
MNFLFNEQSAIEKMIKMQIVDNDNIFATIKDLARYNYFIKEMDNDSSYKYILKYLQKNGKNINEENVYQIIDDCVRRAKKYQLKQVNEICITKNELQFIKNLNDIKQEKIAFVLLSVAKYYDITMDTQRNTAYMKNSDICKLARVTIPVKNRDVFMQFAYDKGVLLRHYKAASTAKTVAFVSCDEQDEIALRLTEGDFKDLAYTYLAYITPHKYRRCVSCRCWIRKDKQDRRICKECSEKEIVERQLIKTGTCIDCGKEFYVDIRNNTKERCDECYEKYRRIQKTETMRKLRAKE